MKIYIIIAFVFVGLYILYLTKKNKSNIYIWRGDISKINIECIVNAANESGLGCFIPNHCIDSAIHLGAGPELLKECKTLGGVPTGSAKITKGYKLKSKYIIHCTGPKASEEDQQNNNFDWKLLSMCYVNMLNLARKHNIKEIALCCLSTGLFGYPKNKSAQVAYNTVKTWILNNNYTFNKIVFVVYSDEDHNYYTTLVNN
jgi:O-acetyl-ADP-ribose deacetylase (regulator of RNase III)